MKKRYGVTALLLVVLLALAAQCGGAAPTQAPAQAPATEAPAEAVTEEAAAAPTEEVAEAPAATEEAASGETATSRAIKIAIMGPFTGDAASIGTEQLNFARLAVKDFNQKMGTNIELVEEDTQLDPAIATTVAQKLVADPEIYAVIGPSGSQEVEASAQLFEEAQLAHVSPSATRPTLTQSGYKTFFRVVPNDDVQGPTDAKFIMENLQAKSVVIIDDQSSYSVSLSDIVEKLLTDGGLTVTRESVTQEDSDFSALVTKIKAAGADVVFFPGQIATQGAQLWKQMREQGVEATLMGGDGFNSPDLIADGANEGSYVSNFAPDIKGLPEAAEVAEAYSAEYGEFGAFGPPTYVAAQVIMEAIGRAMQSGAVTRESVLAEVAKTDIPQTILGTPIKFDANGDVEGAQFYIFKVEGGQFKLVTE